MKKIFPLAVFIALFSLAFHGNNNYEIAGIVTDSSQEPLIGATVLIKGTSTGTITDIDGRFKVPAQTKCVTAVVSYTGFNTEELTICFGDENKVMLNEGVSLDEVVVTGMAVEREEKAMGYATMSISAPAAQNMMSYSRIAPEPESSGESYANIEENVFRKAQYAPQSTFSIDVDAASYSNLRRFLNDNEMPPSDAVRIEEMINYFNYTYPLPTDDTPFAVKTEVTPCPWQPDHLLMHVAIQGEKIPHQNIPASNFVFLLDVSGSMGSPDKLPLLKESLMMLTDNLREEDKVSIVVYAGAAGVVLEPTSGNDKPKIREALDRLRSGGSTAGGAGIELAYKVAAEEFIEDGNNRVILATDGDFNVGVSSNEALVTLIEEKRESGVFLSVLGFGTGNLQDSKMESLADKGNGNYAYIDNIAEARKVLVTEFGGTLFTIAKDVKIQVDFNAGYVKAYRLIGYENRMLNNQDFADDTKDAGELGAGHTVTALYEIIPTSTRTDIKYSTDTIAPVDLTSFEYTELARVKLRYKTPTGETSQFLESKQDYYFTTQDWGQASSNFRWAAAVAEFGMLLRNSPHRGTATYEHCKTIAQEAIGRDPFGYRKEMIELIGKAERISSAVVAEGDK